MAYYLVREASDERYLKSVLVALPVPTLVSKLWGLTQQISSFREESPDLSGLCTIATQLLNWP